MALREKEEYKGYWPAEKESNLQKNLAMINRVVSYCCNEYECRRVLQLAYFGELFDRDLCGNTCDNCQRRAGSVQKDFIGHARALFKLLQELISVRSNPSVTLIKLVQIYQRSKDKSLAKFASVHTPPYDDGRKTNRDELERVLQMMVVEDFLEERSEKNNQGYTNEYIGIGARGGEFEHRTDIQILVAVKKTGSPACKAGSREDDESKKRKDRPEPQKPLYPSKQPIYIDEDDEDVIETQFSDVHSAPKLALEALGAKGRKRVSDENENMGWIENKKVAGGAPKVSKHKSADGRSSITSTAINLEQRPPSQGAEGKALLSKKQRQKLRSWLDDYRRQNFVAYWNHLSEQQLEALSEAPPVTMAELRAFNGIRMASLEVRHAELNNEKFGEHLLATIYAFLEEHDCLHVHEINGRTCSIPTIDGHISWRGPFDFN